MELLLIKLVYSALGIAQGWILVILMKEVWDELWSSRLLVILSGVGATALFITAFRLLWEMP